MARFPMVTRTIMSTKVTLMCLDVVTAEPCNKVVTVTRTYKDDEKLMKVVKPLVETENLKVVCIVGKETQETLYGMSEQSFMEHAQVLPSRKGTDK